MAELPTDTVEITDMDSMFKAVNTWYTVSRMELDSVLNLPDDYEIKIEGPTGEQVPLTSEEMKGFKLGIQLALDTLGDLPIGVTAAESDTDVVH